MERCYQYFSCPNHNCKMNGFKGEQPCWNAEGTLCHFHDFEFLVEGGDITKMEICDICIYASKYKIRYESG